MHKATIICGPTASGKTNYAHRYARQRGGEIVNIDSIQVYKGLPILTASPEKSLRSQLPYHLYNFKDPSDDYSVAEYIADCTKIVRDIASRDRLPVLVGGTGMYINALVDGINNIPDITPDTRLRVRDLHAEIGPEKLHAELSGVDPEMAARLKPGDSQRIMRAMEVFQQTGKSLLFFQQQDKVQFLPEFAFELILLLPSRDLLYRLCNERLEQMFESGAIEEVQSLLRKGKPLGESFKKALGVPQIISYLEGHLTKQEALEIASAKTRQYAKRQTTWFSNQLTPSELLVFDSLEEYHAIIAKL